jgi:hypothetical protein
MAECDYEAMISTGSFRIRLRGIRKILVVPDNTQLELDLHDEMDHRWAGTIGIRPPPTL